MPSASLKRRIEKIERRSARKGDRPIVTFRVIVRSVVGRVNWENSTYRQVPNRDGSVTEVIYLDGSTKELTDGELEAWIQGQAAATWGNPMGGVQ